jgi:ribonuclease Z
MNDFPNIPTFVFMKFELTILGCSSATPTFERNPTAQILNSNDRLFLIDCGEGTQMQFRKFKIKYQRIDHIFISHLHGDHYLGLAPLLFTFHLFGRTREMHLYANAALEEIIHLQLKASDTTLLYPLIFHALEENKSEKLFEDEKLSITSIPLLHRVPTHGFVFRQQNNERNINAEKIAELKIPYGQIKAIKLGADFTGNNGTVYPNKLLTKPLDPAKVYAYCSDTGYYPEIIPFIQNANLLYHETTFMQNMETNAFEKQHSTTIQAGNIALKAKVKHLLIGHYSARYDDLEPLLHEVQSVFPQAELAMEGKTIQISDL